MSVTFGSVRHIQKHSKMVSYLGIKPNLKLMNAYGICWAFALLICIEYVISHTLFFANMDDYRDNKHLQELRKLMLAIGVIYCEGILVTVLLDLLILYTIHSMSNKLSI